MNINLITPAPRSAAVSGFAVYHQMIERNLADRGVTVSSHKVVMSRWPFLRNVVPTAVEPHPLHGICHFTRILGTALIESAWSLPTIVTVHDLGAKVASVDRGAPLSRLAEHLFEPNYRALKRASHLITSSNYTKQTVIDTFNIAGDCITTVYIGVDQAHFRPADKAAARALLAERYRLSFETDTCYLLYVGSEAPRKNLPLLLRALKALRLRHRAVHLIKVGGAGGQEHRSALLRQINDLGLAEDVTFVDVVPYADLPQFYAAADIYVQPSLIEGFGIPVAEALACGCPVLASRSGALPEIVGDCGWTFHAHSVEDLLHQLESLVNDATSRTARVQAGLGRARLFSIESMMQALIGVYTHVAHTHYA